MCITGVCAAVPCPDLGQHGGGQSCDRAWSGHETLWKPGQGASGRGEHRQCATCACTRWLSVCDTVNPASTCCSHQLPQDCALSVYKPNPRQYVAKIPQVGAALVGW